MSSDSSCRVVTDVFLEPFVRGLLHQPGKPNGNGLVLTHGAGSNCKAPLLVGVAEAFCGAGYFVLRCDLPFRQDRAYGPPAPYEAKRDRAGLKNAVTFIKQHVEGNVFLGGHSYGGRQASMLCAEEPDATALPVAGLLLLSYPLHPQKKPDQLRTQHFFNLKTPALFVQGTRDPFGTIEEMGKAIRLIPAKTRLLTVEGAGHDLGFKGKAKKAELPGTVLTDFQSFFASM